MKAFKITVVALLVALPLLGYALQGRVLDATVTSEPIPCVQVGEKLVCFEDPPSGEMCCRAVDASTILCAQP
jgi:hypothetical protein